jgi:hypothetical protein
VRRLLAVGAGLVLGRAALAAVRRSAPPGSLERTNYRGRAVSLAGGPALALATSAAGAAGGLGAAGQGRAGLGRAGRDRDSQGRAGRGRPGQGRADLAAATLVAGLGAGAVGLYDDIAGTRPHHRAKGFRGHLRALREGRVTTGLVKVVGVSAVALAAASTLPTRRPGRAHRTVEVLLGAGVIAGTANLVNLLDLRPGRALKASLALSAIVGGPGHPDRLGAGARGVAAGAAGAAAALIADDLGEHVMIGDCGANALGAVLGVAAAARTGPVGRAVLLTGLAALTAASERVSFTTVIESTPGLRHLDRLGRRA